MTSPDTRRSICVSNHNDHALPMENNPLRSLSCLLAAWIAGCALSSGTTEVAGTLLVDLDAADFAPGAEKWPQHSAATGITGDFIPKGSPTRQTVAGAEAVVFDGDGDYFVGPITTAALHAPGAKHSVEIWVFQGNVRDQESVVSWGKRWGRPNLSFAAFRYGSDPEFGAIARWGAAEMGFAAVPPPGRWHHIVYTYDGKQQSVYVDGERDASTAAGLLDAHDMLPIHLGVEICGDMTLEGQFTHYSGALARVRIHSGALNPQQVKRNFDAERPGFPGLIAKRLQQAPLHRFSFNAPAGPVADGTPVIDSIGGLCAWIRGANAEFTGTAVQLPGGSSATEAYVDFPNGLISSGESLTIEFWETQSAAQVWCRILSIGTNKVGEITGPGGDFTGSETLTLFGNVGATQVNRFARSFGIQPNGGPDRDPVNYPGSDYGVEFHQVITYHKDLAEWHWYRNGHLMEVIPDEGGPTTIDDVNVWLGRSEFSADNNFCGLINEFRIYRRTLDDGEIYGNFLAGPDALDLAREAWVSNWTPVEPGTHPFDNPECWNTVAGGAHPDGPGSIATFASAVTGDQDIAVSAPVTLGAINLGARSQKGSFTLRGGNSNRLTMDSGNPGPASITQLTDSRSNFLKLPVLLHSNTEVANPSPNPLFIEGGIRGSGTLIKTGTGPLALTGDGREYSGQVKIVAGSLIVGDSALPAATRFTIIDPGQLVLDPGKTITLAGSYRGSGSIVHQGAANVTASAETAFTHSGPLTIKDGAGTFISEGEIDGPLEIRSDSELILRANSKTRLRQWLSIGAQNGGALTIRDSASVEIDGPGHLNIGDLGHGQSTMSMEGGSLSCKEMFIGKNTGTSGVLLQSGGTLTKTGQLDTRLGGGLPGNHQTWGAWRMTGGTFVDEWNLQIGAHGIGVMEIDGGTVKVAGFLGIGRYEDDQKNPSHGVLDVKSGSVTTSAADHLLLIGEEGIGVLNIRGSGSVVCANRMIIGAGTIDKPGDGTVNLLPGGTLTTSGIGQFNQAEAVGRLFFDGGTLKAGSSSAAFLEGIDFAYVGKGGAHIDSNGHDVRISQSLLAPEGKGLRHIPISNGGAGYSGAPWIGIKGGGGSGATAVANLIGGTIKSITVTHPGNNYTSIPEIEVLGGGAGTGLIPGSPTLAENASGGLVKTGAGILTLGGTNSYTGVTSVEMGGLRLEGHLAGPVEVAAGASFSGNGSIEGSVTIAQGSTISPDSGGALNVRGDVTVHGRFEIEIAGAGAGRIQCGKTLDLNGAKLVLKSSATRPGTSVHLIASYRTLDGKFAKIESLPAGYAIDYHYQGLNQIALVATADDTDGD